MTHLILLIVITALFIQGWHYCIQYDPFVRDSNGLDVEYGATNKEVFWFVKFYGRKIIPAYFHKPLFNCPVCMSSFYGSIAYWAHVYHTGTSVNLTTFVTWFVFCVTLAGANRIITKFIMS